jgi:hypothetical protein
MTIVELLSGTMLIQGYFQFECVVSQKKNHIFLFPLATAKLIGNCRYNRQCVANRFISAIAVATYWRTEFSFMNRVCEANKKSLKVSLVCLAYSGSVLSFRASPFSRSFQLSSRSCLMVLPAFLSFLLSGRSSFSPVTGSLKTS